MFLQVSSYFNVAGQRGIPLHSTALVLVHVGGVPGVQHGCLTLGRAHVMLFLAACSCARCLFPTPILFFCYSLVESGAPAQISFGFGMGICCGFAAKKTAKAALVGIGLAFGSLQVSQPVP